MHVLGMMWYGMGWHGMSWYVIAWYDVVPYCMIERYVVLRDAYAIPVRYGIPGSTYLYAGTVDFTS